jgi:hypothetical protein
MPPRKSSGGKRFPFPNRKSGYIDHFKTQQRVNSAKVKFSSNPPISPYSPRERASTAPHFPVTKFDNSSSGQEITTANVQDICSEHKATGGRIRTSAGRQTQTSMDLEDAASLFTESKSLLRDTSQRRFNVRETAEGTMYIDNGKVFFIKRSRNDPTNLLKSRTSDGGFLASIRKDYLKKPKYITAKGEKPEQEDNTVLQHERVYYNQKVGHILDYYCRDDEDRLSIDDLAKYTRSSPRATTFSRNVSPRTSRVRKLYIAPDQDEISPRGRSPELLEDPNINSYIKVNFQSKLHDRKFYLRTPAVKPDFHNLSTTDIDNCKCGICKIEMQLSLMEKLGIGYPLTKSQTQGVAAQNQTKQEIPTQKIKDDSRETQKDTIPQNEGRSGSDIKTTTVVAKQQENSPITITVPGMNLEREGTQTESIIDTARTPLPTPVP